MRKNGATSGANIKEGGFQPNGNGNISRPPKGGSSQQGPTNGNGGNATPKPKPKP